MPETTAEPKVSEIRTNGDALKFTFEYYEYVVGSNRGLENEDEASEIALGRVEETQNLEGVIAAFDTTLDILSFMRHGLAEQLMLRQAVARTAQQPAAPEASSETPA